MLPKEYLGTQVARVVLRVHQGTSGTIFLQVDWWLMHQWLVRTP